MRATLEEEENSSSSRGRPFLIAPVRIYVLTPKLMMCEVGSVISNGFKPGGAAKKRKDVDNYNSQNAKTPWNGTRQSARHYMRGKVKLPPI